MLIYVENLMKSTNSFVRIDKLVLQTDARVYIKIENVLNGQNYFKKELRELTLSDFKTCYKLP